MQSYIHTNVSKATTITVMLATTEMNVTISIIMVIMIIMAVVWHFDNDIHDNDTWQRSIVGIANIK